MWQTNALLSSFSFCPQAFQVNASAAQSTMIRQLEGKRKITTAKKMARKNLKKEIGLLPNPLLCPNAPISQMCSFGFKHICR
jgi:hypothetical protein